MQVAVVLIMAVRQDTDMKNENGPSPKNIHWKV